MFVILETHWKPVPIIRGVIKTVTPAPQRIPTAAAHSSWVNLTTAFDEKNRTQKDIYSSITLAGNLKSRKTKLLYSIVLYRNAYVGYKTISK